MKKSKMVGGVDIGVTKQILNKGSVVTCATIIHGVQSPDGDLVPCERLGPGLVEGSASDGRMRVWWTMAGFSSLLDPDDIRTLGSDARLVSVHKYDKVGHSKLLRHKIVSGVGFRHNWTVELRPGNVIRVQRWDGHAWTFTKNPIFMRITTPAWSAPPDDDDAEALTAAELSLSG
ncbi:MAG: hypothetical protein ABIO92_01635 [Chloroflexia bacterium]